jgi:hypothetical protein
MNNLARLYNDIIDAIIAVVEEYGSGKSISHSLGKGNRMLFLGILLIIFSVLLIPIID